MAGRVGFEFQLTQPRARGQRLDEDHPLRILVLADLSGRANRGKCEPADLADRSVLAIDVDTFDRVMGRLQPRIHLAPAHADAAEVVFEPRGLDDFHPDHLYRELPLFQELRATRARLQDTRTFAEAAAGLRAGATAARARAPNEANRAENDAATLDRLLGGGGRPAAAAAEPAGGAAAGIEALIRRIVAPHIVPDAPPFQAEYVRSIELAISEQMRALLHQPAFQALEAAWRSVHSLVCGLETGEQIKLFVMDVSRDELAADMASAGDPARSGLHRRLVEQGARAVGGEPWSLIVGNYTFAATPADMALLGALGAVAAQAGGPLLAGADASLAGCASLVSSPDPTTWLAPGGEGGETWRDLRRSAVAPWIGLALPRLMLRLPYGRKTDAVDSFDFEEASGNKGHDEYLWGNAAFGCALLIGRAFTERGPDMEPGDVLDVEDLPAHIVERDGDKRMQACAELFLTERAGEALLAAGLIPLVSYRNRNAARVLRFQSVAQPAQPLAGPWG